MRAFQIFERKIPKSIGDDIIADARARGFSTDKVWYHGSRRRFTAFKAPREGAGVQELGSGIYLTGEWNYANTWAGPEGFVYECFLRDMDIFDHSKTQDLFKELHDRHSRMMDAKFGPGSAYDEEMFAELFKKILVRTISGPRLDSEFLKKIGYHAAIDPRSQIPDQICVFNPEDIFIAARAPGGTWGDRPSR